MKIREVRQPVLLAPPADDRSWMRMTESDVRTMGSALEDVRKSEYRLIAVPRTYYVLRQLGLDAPITDPDRRRMETDLAEARRDKDGATIASLLYYMRELGFKVEATPGDKMAIADGFKTIKGHGEIGLFLMHHFHARKLGMETVITPEDAEWADKVFLEEHTRAHGNMLLGAYCNMRLAGIVKEVPKEHQELIRRSLRGFREANMGAPLADMLYELQVVFPDLRDEAKADRMPPIKRF